MAKDLLIVDDNLDLVEILFDSFLGAFDLIETAYSIEEARAHVSLKKFSLIILDINLNNRNGAELVKFIKDEEQNLNKATPVIILSGLVNPQFIDQYQSRFAAIFSKPFDLEELKNKAIDISKTSENEVGSEEISSEELPDLKYAGPFAVDALKEQVDQVMNQVKKSAKLKQLFKQAKVDRNADSYVLTHIGMIVNISAAICIKMEWGSDKTLEKFVYAAYLHDMTISARADLARINSFEKLEILKEKLSEEEYRLVFEHPNIAAKTVAGLSEVPPDVEVMIRQHHELPNQTGFPAKCGYQKITPFSAVFIVAHHLADYIIDNPKWTMDDFLTRNKGRLHGSHFTKIVRSLADLK